MTKGSPSIKSAGSIALDAKVSLQLFNGSNIDATHYLYDTPSDCLVLYASRDNDTFTDLRIIRRSAIKDLSAFGDKPMGSKSNTPTVSGKTTPRKSTATSLGQVDTRQGTTESNGPEMSEQGRLLLEGLGKHLSVSSRGASIIVSLVSGKVKIDPPYTKVEGEGEELAKVKRILDSERSILPKKTKKKDINVPARGG